MPDQPKRPLRAHEVYEDTELLRRIGWGILDMERETGIGFEDVRSYAYLVHPEDDRQAASRRIMRLLGRYFAPEVAGPMWREILGYKAWREREEEQEVPMEEAAREWYRRHGRDWLRQHYLNRQRVPDRVPGVPERGSGLVEKVVEWALPDLSALLEAGFGVVDVARVSRSYLGRMFRCSVVRRCDSEERGRFYVDLIARLTGYEIPPSEAPELWARILEHKWYLSERAGRDVGIQTAALDFFKRLKLADEQADPGPVSGEESAGS